MKSLLALAFLAFSLLAQALTPEELAKAQKPFLAEAARRYPGSVDPNSPLATKAREIYESWVKADVSYAQDPAGALLCYDIAASKLGITYKQEGTWDYLHTIGRMFPQAADPNSALCKKAREVMSLWAKQNDTRALRAQGAFDCYIEAAKQLGIEPLKTLEDLRLEDLREKEKFEAEAHARRMAAAKYFRAEEQAWQAQREQDMRAAAQYAYNQRQAEAKANAATQSTTGFAAGQDPSYTPRPYSYSTPSRSEPARTLPPAPGAPGYDLNNTVDYHFSPGGAWLHGSDGHTFHVTRTPGGYRLDP